MLHAEGHHLIRPISSSHHTSRAVGPSPWAPSYAEREDSPIELGANPELDLVMNLARQVFQTAWCQLSWRTARHVWVTQTPGEPPVCLPPEDSPCHVALQRNEVVISADARLDAQLGPCVQRWADDAQIRFLACAPLHDERGQAVGAFSVADDAPRDAIDPAWASELREFASLAMNARTARVARSLALPRAAASAGRSFR